MSSSSLSSVVSNLVRASIGSSVPANVTDEELDRHVAELILKEAKQKAERYLKDGVRAFLPEKEPDPNLPKPNKRFLSAIIRNTDEHNRSILRAQAEAAQEAKGERDKQERRERRVRALEATEAERLRRLMGGSSRLRREDDWDKQRDSGRRRQRRESEHHNSPGHEDEGNGSRKHKKRSRSRSPTRKDGSDYRRSRRRDEEVREEGSSRRRRKRSRSRSPGGERHRTSRKHDSRSRSRREDSAEVPSIQKGKGRDLDEPQIPPKSSRPSARGTSRELSMSEASDDDLKDIVSSLSHQPCRSLSASRKASPIDLSAQFKARKAKLASTPPPPASPTLSEEEDIERFRPRRRRRVSPDAKQDDMRPVSPAALPSKMDKYFEESYDPRLDTGPLTLPNVPSTGLVNGAEFEGWEAMLDIIRQRREDKAERKRLERLGLLPDTKPKEKEVKKLNSTEAWSMEAGTSALDIKYNRRGAVREWDLGKAGS